MSHASLVVLNVLLSLGLSFSRGALLVRLEVFDLVLVIEDLLLDVDQVALSDSLSTSCSLWSRIIEHVPVLLT